MTLTWVEQDMPAEKKRHRIHFAPEEDHDKVRRSSQHLFTSLIDKQVLQEGSITPKGNKISKAT
jgi:hypothetical protein